MYKDFENVIKRLEKLGKIEAELYKNNIKYFRITYNI